MKRTIVVLIVLFVVVGVCFADVSTWHKQYFVDDFGDPTDEPYLITDPVNIQYGDSSWESSYCYILVEPEYVSFILNGTTYSDWFIKTKTSDGEVHNYYGELNNSGRIAISSFKSFYLSPDSFVQDLLDGCKVVLIPDNRYATKKFDFGMVNLELDQLMEVRLDW